MANEGDGLDMLLGAPQEKGARLMGSNRGEIYRALEDISKATSCLANALLLDERGSSRDQVRNFIYDAGSNLREALGCVRIVAEQEFASKKES